MLTIEEEKLLNDVHSRVLEYLNDIDIKPNKTEKEIRYRMDMCLKSIQEIIL